MHKNATLLIFSVLAVMPVSLIFNAKVTALPSPFVVAAAILGLVAAFGAIISLLLRRRGKNKGR